MPELDALDSQAKIQLQCRNTSRERIMDVAII